MEKPTTCLNCNSPLYSGSNYCSECGQEVKGNINTFKDFLNHFLKDYFTYDNKLIKSLVPLFNKPGHLTKEFFAGRRVRYIAPLRLYIFISIVFFLMLNWFGSDGSSAVTDESAFWDSFFGNYLPKIFFLLLPLFALIMLPLYLKLKASYVKHFVFALHFHSFLFLATLLYLLISELFQSLDLLIINQVLAAILSLLILLYLFFSLLRVYRQHIGTTLLKFFVLLLVYFGILSLVTVVSALLISSWAA
jgi:hypothetical protein